MILIDMLCSVKLFQHLNKWNISNGMFIEATSLNTSFKHNIIIN